MIRESRHANVVWLAIVSAALAGGAWWWRTSVFGAGRVELISERWDQVKEHYLMAPAPVELAPRSAELAEAVVQANPFASERRALPPSDAETPAGGGGGSPPAPKPQFVYKGQINLGSRQRAIIEDTVAKKTYFIETGQVVAGFKVLDIAENRVVLSDPQTNEEVVVSLIAPASP